MPTIFCYDGSHICSDKFTEISSVLHETLDLVGQNGDESFHMKELGGCRVSIEHFHIIEKMLIDISSIFTMKKMYMCYKNNPNAKYKAKDLITCIIICNFFNIQELLMPLSIIYNLFKGQLNHETWEYVGICDKKKIYNLISSDIKTYIDRASSILETHDYEKYKICCDSNFMLYVLIFKSHSIRITTYDMWIFAIKCNAHNLEFMPVELVNKEIIKEVAYQEISLKYLIKLYPQYVDNEIYCIHLDNNGGLSQIPQNHITIDLINRAFFILSTRQLSSFINDIPIALLSQNLVDKIWNMKNYIKDLSSVPENFITTQMCRDAFKHKEYSYNIIWDYVPIACITKELLYMVSSFITHQKFEDLNDFDLSKIPTELFNDIKICKLLLNVKGSCFIHMPISLITVDFCLDCIKTLDDYERIIHHIPDDILKCEYFANQLKLLFPTVVSIYNKTAMYTFCEYDEYGEYYDVKYILRSCDTF